MSVALLPTSCRSFCSFSSDLLKTNRSTQVGTGKAWKGKTRGHQPFPKTILHSVYSWVVPALQITLELLKLDQFSFSIKRGLKFLLEALQGLTSITRKIRRSFNLSATLWYKRSYRPDFQEPPKDHMKILHGAFTRFFISSCMLASSSRACQLPQLDEVSKRRKNQKPLVSSLLSLAAFLTFLPGNHFRGPKFPIRCNRVRRFCISGLHLACSPLHKLLKCTPWRTEKTEQFISNCGNWSKCSAKIAAPKKKNAISSPLACHLDPFVKL